MSLPNAIESPDLLLSYSCELIISLKRTISRFSLGTSSPITDLPGITSTIRTLMVDNARARSLARLLIWLTLTPAAGCNSNRVITGPG